MRERDTFITFINEFKTVSPTITDQQRIGLLQRAVQQHGLSVDEASDILNAAGMIIGDKDNFFQVLGISIEQIHELDDHTIVNIVKTAHDKHYRASLTAGARIRPDGKTEDQWRMLLNQAHDTLIDTIKRAEHIAMLRKEKQNLEADTLSISDLTDVDITTHQGLSQYLIPDNVEVPDSMVYIPAGEFQMGSIDEEANDDEQPVHTVFLDAFLMDKYPVTNAQFKIFVDENPHWRNLGWVSVSYVRKYRDSDYLKNWYKGNYPKGTGNHPVNWVSWYASMAYSQWIGKRLPTEAEWEKAARGGLVSKKYPWGDLIDSTMANFGNYIGSTTDVGKYPPNGYGIYDIIGNVNEWCLDEWDGEFYKPSENHNPVSGGSIENISKDFKKSKTSRVIRGGSWYSAEHNARVSNRDGLPPWKTYSIVGFRCAKEITQ